jgi:hypothetical protein
MPLIAAIEVSTAQPDSPALRVKLRITNPAGGRVAIHNPDMGVPSPAMNWPFSREVYQTFLLMSFGYLSILVTDEAGRELPRQTIATSATPALKPRLNLGPGDSFEVPIPLDSFYQLQSRTAYRVAIQYGDQDLKVSAETRVTVP